MTPIKCYYVVLLILLSGVIQLVLSTTESRKNSLFEGEKLADFQKACVDRDENCKISSPDDFKRLRLAKGYVRDQLQFLKDPFRLGVLLFMQLIICGLMIHLTCVRRFDWRTLPIICQWYEEIQEEQNRKNGIRYNQFIWMKYSVLEGSHPLFKGRDFNSIHWYRYNKNDKAFDYKRVKIEKFTFLDKAQLTKHLVVDASEKKNEDD